MKPLVYWCRWHEARLRLRGRGQGAVWGELVFEDRTERFHFDLARSILTIGEVDKDGKGVAGRQLQLDDMGVERQSDA